MANNVPLGKSSKYSRTTDAAGRFSIRGIVGLTLAVEITKPGYRVIPYDGTKVTSSGMFEYGIPSGKTHIPDSNAPVVFALHKIEAMEPLVKVGKKNFRLARDGTPVLISTDNKGGHQVQLCCWNQELQRPPGQRQYDWRLEVSVPGGGLIPRTDSFDFVAPQDGYVSSDLIDMPASLGRAWSLAAERSYFVHFEDGTFARVDLEMEAHGDHFVIWESFFNPKAGSPNLENDPEKDARVR